MIGGGCGRGEWDGKGEGSGEGNGDRVTTCLPPHTMHPTTKCW